MSGKKVFSRIAAGAIAMATVAGFAVVAQAQSLTCKYVTGQADPLTVLNNVTDQFDIPITAIETNSDETQLKKASGLAVVSFLDVGEIEDGVFAAEMDFKLKDTDDGSFSCPNSVAVRGVGGLAVVDEDSGLVIRSNSKLDGRTRTGTLLNCGGVLTVGGPCSVHRVSANLRITAQGERSNGSRKYDRFTVKQKDIFEAVEGVPPTGSEDVVLVCSCAPSIAE